LIEEGGDAVDGWVDLWIDFWIDFWIMETTGRHQALIYSQIRR
jgi:hypothetical protein